LWTFYIERQTKIYSNKAGETCKVIPRR
jgi:hypothetical protein